MRLADYRAIVSGQRRDFTAVCSRSLLRVASWPYRIAVLARNWAYNRGWSKSYSIAVPIISVGNITAGGTGKTPLVAAIAQHLREREVRVGLVSRGYRSDASGSNDEARELYDSLPDVPHIQNPDRVAACQVMVDELEMEAIIVDDGFQHRRLRRDLDIVVVDATCPWGYGYLLPRGLLREPVKNLRRAHAVVISRTNFISQDELQQLLRRVQQLAPQAALATAEHTPCYLICHDGPNKPLRDLQGSPVLAFAGIGNPQPFFAELQRLGANVIGTLALPDHCGYDRDTVSAICQWIRERTSSHPTAVLVCTHKDLVKLRTDQLADHPLLALKIELTIQAGAEKLWQVIDNTIAVNSSCHDDVTST